MTLVRFGLLTFVFLSSFALRAAEPEQHLYAGIGNNLHALSLDGKSRIYAKIPGGLRGIDVDANGNIRVLRNRMFNCPSQPISSQPIHAGPVYWIHNILWNVYGGRGNFKEHSGAQAYVFMHNTASGHMMTPFHMSPPPDKTTWWIQNNLSIGIETSKTQARYLPNIRDERHIASHNAYRAGVPDGEWVFGKESFSSLETFEKATGQEQGSIMVPGYEVFARAIEPPHTKKDTPLVYPDEVDLQPRPGSPIDDAGLLIPGVNDDFSGKTPDIGALKLTMQERGQPKFS